MKSFHSGIRRAMAWLFAVAVGSAVSASGEMADEYLVPARVADGKMVSFLPMSEIKSRADAEAWGRWVERTHPSFAGNVVPKWDKDDPFSVKLGITGLDSILSEGDSAVGADGKNAFVLIAPAEDGRASLELDRRDDAGQLSPMACATNLWVLPWTQLSNRWESAIANSEFSDIVRDIGTIRKSGRFDFEGGAVWSNRVASFEEKKLKWPSMKVANRGQVAVSAKFVFSTDEGTQCHEQVIETGKAFAIDVFVDKYGNMRELSYDVHAEADGYEPFNDRITLARGSTNVSVVIKLKQKKVEKKTVSPQGSGTHPESAVNGPAKPGPAAEVPQKRPAQIPVPEGQAKTSAPVRGIEAGHGGADVGSAGSQAVQPPVAPVKQVQPWPTGNLHNMSIAAIRYYSLFVIGQRNNKTFFATAYADKDVVAACRHIAECDGCDKCKQYKGVKAPDGYAAGNPRYVAFLCMLKYHLDEKCGKEHRKTHPIETIDKNIRAIVKPDGL